VTTPLLPLAEAICLRYRAEFPDEELRYGEAGAAWCRHDLQWLLSWAVGDVQGTTDLSEQVSWLARVLAARGFPLTRLARGLQLASETAAAGAFGTYSPAVAQRLLVAEQLVISLETVSSRPERPSPGSGQTLEI